MFSPESRLLRRLEHYNTPATCSPYKLWSHYFGFNSKIPQHIYTCFETHLREPQVRKHRSRGTDDTRQEQRHSLLHPTFYPVGYGVSLPRGVMLIIRFHLVLGATLTITSPSLQGVILILLLPYNHAILPHGNNFTKCRWSVDILKQYLR
jgi:hypothetical protein